MSSLLKYGVSVLALTVGIGAANAQDSDRMQGQGGASQAEQKGSSDANRNERMGQSGQPHEMRQGEDDRSDRQGANQGDRDRRENAQAEGGKDRKVVRNVHITNEKKKIIRNQVVAHAPKRYHRDDIHFSLSVGTRVPRNFVVYDVPPAFINIVPEFRGYDYIVVGDVLLIIDPDTREIVDVVNV